MTRTRIALQRALARGDTWVAVIGLWLGGFLLGSDALIGGIVLTVVGMVFLVASGDYVWRKGHVAGRRDAQEGR